MTTTPPAPKSSGIDCTVRFKTSPHDLYPHVETCLRLEAIHPEYGCVGRLTASHIDRRRCEDQFLDIMDEDCDQLYAFGSTFFDEEGRVKAEVVVDEYHKGAGLWGRELSKGILVYIHTLKSQHEAYERLGIASFLLQKLAGSRFAPAGSYIFCCPPDGEMTIDVECLRNIGYRTVAGTNFLAFATASSHPSRCQPFAHDVPQVVEDSGIPSVNGDHDSPYPLHDHILNPSLDIAQMIRDAYSQDPSLIRQRNPDGFTLLHLAACSDNVTAVRSLLALPTDSGVYESLRARSNKEGLTPHEICEREMCRENELQEKLLGTAAQVAPEKLRVLYLLKQAMGEDLHRSEDEFVESLQWGCTCEQCADGWLSPRMRDRLSVAATENAIMMKAYFPSGTPRSINDNAVGIKYLPAYMHGGVTDHNYKIYRSLVECVAGALAMPGATELLKISGGGPLVRSALDFVAHSAMTRSPLVAGHGWDDLVRRFMHAVARSPLEEGPSDDPMGIFMAARSLADIDGLPECANDLNFWRVAERLGLPNRNRYLGSDWYKLDKEGDAGYKDVEEDDGFEEDLGRSSDEEDYCEEDEGDSFDDEDSDMDDDSAVYMW